MQNNESLMTAIRNLKASQAARYGQVVETVVTVQDLTDLELAAYHGCASALKPSDVLSPSGNRALKLRNA
jgi:hypothetical protein